MRRTAAALPRVKSASKLRSGQAPLIKNRGVLFGLSKPKLRRQPSSPRRKPSCSASGSASGFWCASALKLKPPGSRPCFCAFIACDGNDAVAILP